MDDKFIRPSVGVAICQENVTWGRVPLKYEILLMLGVLPEPSEEFSSITFSISTCSAKALGAMTCTDLMTGLRSLEWLY